jgi:serine/threonine protein kinase
MSDLPNADKVCFDTSRFTYNNLRKMLPSLSEKGLDLMNKLLTYDPKKRITAKEAMSHPYFKEKPFPQETTLMPTFPSIHGEMAKHRASIQPEESKGRYLDDRFGKAFEAKRRRM